ncbi:MAG: stage II sporulation protein R [Clostridia bacterium]|nr:stage II sporulation protein R [Clostridia bacterium]
MKKVLMVLLSLILIFSYALVYADGIQKSIAGSVVRFHILANSDSEFDQSVKFSVRDYVSEKLQNGELTLENIQNYANEKLEELGVEYRAEAKYERVFIEKKDYLNLSFPSGEYKAVRLVLGEGKGQNWWCVAYPSLCFTENAFGQMSEKGQKELEDSMEKTAYETVSGEKEYRFFIVDFFSQIKERLAR